MRCDKCGFGVDVDMSRGSHYGACVCGATVQDKTPGLANDIGVLFTALGCTFTLDYDDSLIVESAAVLNDGVLDWLCNHQRTICDHIKYTGKKRRAVFIGGPLAGQRHDYWQDSWRKMRVTVHKGRAHWEVYDFRDRDDPRLYYVGRSTSEAKAKRGEYVNANKTLKEDPHEA